MAPAGIGSTRESGGGATVLAGVTVEVVVLDVGTVGRPAVVDGADDDDVVDAPVVVGAPVVGAVVASGASSLHDASSAAAAAAAPCWSRRRRVSALICRPR